MISNDEEEENAKSSGPTVPRQPVSTYIDAIWTGRLSAARELLVVRHFFVR